MPATSFSHYPDKPRSTECLNADPLLLQCPRFFNFLSRRIQRSPASEISARCFDRRGAGSPSCLFGVCLERGLDSMAKRLVKEALPKVIDQNLGAHSMLRRTSNATFSGT